MTPYYNIHFWISLKIGPDFFMKNYFRIKNIGKPSITKCIPVAMEPPEEFSVLDDHPLKYKHGQESTLILLP